MMKPMSRWQALMQGFRSLDLSGGPSLAAKVERMERPLSPAQAWSRVEQEMLDATRIVSQEATSRSQRSSM